MGIYLFTILLLFVFSCLEFGNIKEFNKNTYLFLVCTAVAYLLLVFQVGLRWETGTDWEPYLNHFNSVVTFSDTSPLANGFELGYNLIVWLVKQVFSNYSIFLLIHASFFYFVLFFCLRRYSSIFFLSLLLFYVSTMGVMGSSRQLLAIMICLYSLKYVYEKRPIRFFVLILIAINFHITAFLFAICYFMNKELKVHKVILILLLCIIVGKTSLPFDVFSFGGNLIGGDAAWKALTYITKAEDELMKSQLSTFGLVKRLALLFLFYYNRSKIIKANPYYNLMLNSYTVGVAFYFLFSSSLLIMVNRGSLYFNMLEPILIAFQFSLLKRRDNKLVISILILAYSGFTFFQSISEYKDLFLPYKGIFINSDYHRDMY